MVAGNEKFVIPGTRTKDRSADRQSIKKTDIIDKRMSNTIIKIDPLPSSLALYLVKQYINKLIYLFHLSSNSGNYKFWTIYRYR